MDGLLIDSLFDEFIVVLFCSQVVSSHKRGTINQCKQKGLIENYKINRALRRAHLKMWSKIVDALMVTYAYRAGREVH